MRQKKNILWILLLVMLLGGCERQNSILIDTTKEELLEEQQESIAVEQEKEDSEAVDAVQKQEEDSGWIYVDLCGAVRNPGVYRIKSGSRVFQVLEQAGGCTPEASLETINQADLLSDGQKIRIYTRDEAAQIEENNQKESLTSGKTQESESDGRININQAGKEELETLTGIGETRAQAILAYREVHGAFSSVEELMQVEGIKEKTYEKLKDQIRID